jgi:putative membrane protein
MSAAALSDLDRQVLAITRPHPDLLKLYMIRALLTGPGLLIAVPLLYFRYHTMRYAFDAEGVRMSWGILFRREVNLAYRRIQDIHLTSSLLQRWLGLADVQVQTASGSATAEMTIEGIKEYEVIRDFLYAHMRGGREQPAAPVAPAGVASAGDETAARLGEAVGELRRARVALESLGTRP